MRRGDRRLGTMGYGRQRRSLKLIWQEKRSHCRLGTEMCRCVWGNLKWGRQRAEMDVLLSPRREAESQGIQGSTPEVHERRGLGPQCGGRMGLRAGGRLSPLYPRRGREETGTPGAAPLGFQGASEGLRLQRDRFKHLVDPENTKPPCNRASKSAPSKFWPGLPNPGPLPTPVSFLLQPQRGQKRHLASWGGGGGLTQNQVRNFHW